ncbi:type IV secretory system conjugative DNA transfer family protein [Azospirillum agricola]|uniref:type IV secretory system conjugative DNA transfer family protein n=1 Tax=Azospirillum agricola TaxID=1720247 RepID=UPI000A0F1EE0|nr:type IV secretory system conjugative DNA transfer family protein [Azospirillum agricola]SMH62817.1 type IV secretion system protein VirD4 [Azospirillum lipoferum]
MLPADLLGDIPRGAPRRGGIETRLDDHISPRAQFRDPATIIRSDTFKRSGHKLHLGVIGGRVETVKLPDGRVERHVMGGHGVGLGDDRHAATVAGSRGGKGRCVIIPTLLDYEGSVLATDPKAELFNVTAKRRAKGLGQRVVGLDPFGISGPHVAAYRGSFNPMTILKPGSPTLIEDAGLIADALVIPSGGDSHWDDSARNWLETLILHVATHDAYEGERNLVTMHRLLMRGAVADGASSYDALAAEMLGNDAAFGTVQEGAADFFDKPKEERGSVLSTARRHAKFLSYQAIQRVVSAHDFDLEDLKRQKLTLYLCLPAMRIGTCARWFRLFVNLALAAMERVPVKPTPPVLMCLDEFAVMGHMKTVEDAAGQIAGFGVRLWPILQDLTQLKALYRERWETFLGNAGVIQFFGNNDAFTLEWISKRLGKTSLIVTRRSEVSADSRERQGVNGESWSLEVQDLMTLEEVSRFFARDDHLGRQLVIRAGDDPIILQRVNYDTHEFFKGKFHAER